MALTLTEIFVTPGDDHKRQSVWKITGDGTTYQVAVADLKMTKVEAAWTQNLTSETDVRVVTANYDYVDDYVTTIELGGDGDLEKPISDGAEILLFVIGF